MNVQNQPFTSTTMRYVLLRHCVRIRLCTLVNVTSNRKQSRCQQRYLRFNKHRDQVISTSEYIIVAQQPELGRRTNIRREGWLGSNFYLRLPVSCNEVGLRKADG